MHLGDHCCHYDLYYLYHFDDLTMEVRRTYAGVTMNDFEFHENWANHFGDHVPLIDYDDVVMVVIPIGDDAHDCNDCAVIHVAIAVTANATDVGRLFLISATYIHAPHAHNHFQCRVHVWCRALGNRLDSMPLWNSKHFIIISFFLVFFRKMGRQIGASFLNFSIHTVAVQCWVD